MRGINERVTPRTWKGDKARLLEMLNGLKFTAETRRRKGARGEGRWSVKTEMRDKARLLEMLEG